MPPPVPEGLTYVVGDIHGRLDLLESALDRIEADRDAEPATLVFLGDYVDRGPESASVLYRLSTLKLEDTLVVCLMGNHERMLLDFLDDPEAKAERWLRNGGTETLSSFMLGRVHPVESQSRNEALRNAFRAAMGPELEVWLRGLPLLWKSGTLGCVHAITDPAQPWQAQSDAVLLWGRPSPRLAARSDGIWVAHGHTIVDAPTADCGHIALDTGAYRTGALTVLRSAPAGIRFMRITARD